MVSIKIYIEGGGEGNDLDIRFRRAWTKFFQAAGLLGRMPRPSRGKGEEIPTTSFAQPSKIEKRTNSHCCCSTAKTL